MSDKTVGYFFDLGCQVSFTESRIFKYETVRDATLKADRHRDGGGIFFKVTIDRCPPEVAAILASAFANCANHP